MEAMRPRTRRNEVATIMPRQASPNKGFVLDYLTLNTGQTNYTFKGADTYYITDVVNLSGNTTFEGGAVIKYSTSSTASLWVLGSIECQATHYHPIILTGKDDNTVGEAISGSSGSPTTAGYGNYGIVIDNTTNASTSWSNLRFSHLRTAFHVSRQATHTLSHAQILKCDRGILVYASSDVSARNVLIDQVTHAFDHGSGTARGEHLTVHRATNLKREAYGAHPFYVTNSLMVGVTNIPTSTNSFTSVSSYIFTNDVPAIFQTVGAGSHYLADNTYRNLGTTNVAILSELRKLTTYVPVLLTNTISVDTTLQPQAQRDTNIPDVGYHYEPIDWAVSALAITNATLTLTNGVAVATFGDIGLWLRERSRLVSEGTALARNHISRYNTVQEQSTNWANGSVTGNVSINPYINGTNYPTAEIRFTDFDGLSAGGWHLYMDDGHWVFGTLTLRDCTFNSARVVFAGAAGAVLSLNNNLFERVNNEFTHFPQIDCYNNLFKGGTNFFERYATAGTWTVRDNSFDGCQLANEGESITHSHNAYIAMSTQLSPTNASDKVLSSFSYASGALGRYYQVSTNLYDAGSRTNAALAGLYHHTVKTSQAKETNSTVDIGFHYVAVDGNGVPVDTDGDGLPDYFEDRNGNGTYDSGSGETDWQSSNNGTSGGPGLQTFTPLK